MIVFVQFIKFTRVRKIVDLRQINAVAFASVILHNLGG